jgi:hypothetical protein
MIKERLVKIWNLKSIKRQAKQTAVYPATLGMQYTILGLCGEAGELANKV